jgi:hypothetical protein
MAKAGHWLRITSNPDINVGVNLRIEKTHIIYEKWLL